MQIHYVVRFSSLGDIVLCSGFVRSLKKKFPKDEVYFACQERFVAILNSFPVTVRSLALKERHLFSSFREGVRAGLSLSSEIRRVVIYDLQGSLRSKFFISGLRSALKKNGIDSELSTSPRYSFKRKLSVFLRKDLLGRRHVFADHQRLLNINPPDAITPALRVSPLSPEQQETRAFKILMAPDARHWKKRWLESSWFELIEKVLLSNPRFEITLVGGVDCLSASTVKALQQRHQKRIKNLLGATELNILSSVAAEHALTICSNSAWLHISEAVGTPVISLAGPIVEGFGFSPWHSESRELKVNLECRPCTKHGDGPCHQKAELYHACMNEIKSDVVFSELSEYLFKRKSKHGSV